MSQDTICFQHSAEVEMWLECGEHGRVELNRITPTSVSTRTPRNIPPCRAELVVTVDGKVLRSYVNVVNGFSASNQHALVLPLDDVAPF